MHADWIACRPADALAGCWLPCLPASSPHLQVGAAAEYEPGKLSGAVALDADFEAGIEAQHADYLAVIDGDASGLSDSGLQARGGASPPASSM